MKYQITTENNFEWTTHTFEVTEVENLFFADGNVVIVFNNGNKQLLENVKSVNIK